MALKLGGPFMDIASNPFAGLALNAFIPGAGTAMNTVAGGAKAAGVGGGAGAGAGAGTGGGTPGGGTPGGGGGLSGILSGINKDTAGMLALGMGAAKNLQANIQQRKANAMFPSNEDPELRMLSEDVSVPFKRVQL